MNCVYLFTTTVSNKDKTQQHYGHIGYFQEVFIRQPGRAGQQHSDGSVITSGTMSTSPLKVFKRVQMHKRNAQINELMTPRASSGHFLSSRGSTEALKRPAFNNIFHLSLLHF